MRAGNHGRTAADDAANGRVDRREKVVHARYSAAEFAAIERAAASAQLSVSAFLRSLSLDGAGVLPFLTDEDRAVLALIREELRALEVNLNGLVRVANRAVGLEKSDVFEVAKGLRPALASVVAELDRYTTRIGQKRSGPQ